MKLAQILLPSWCSWRVPSMLDCQCSCFPSVARCSPHNINPDLRRSTLQAAPSVNLNVIMTASKNILFCHAQITRTCCSSKGAWSTTYAERAQNPCKLGKRMCTNCRQIQMAKPAKPAKSMAWASRKKKWRRFHAKHEIHTKNCSMLILHMNL